MADEVEALGASVTVEAFQIIIECGLAGARFHLNPCRFVRRRIIEQEVDIDLAGPKRRLALLPDAMGVYLVVTPDGFDPQYVERGTGGFFKGRDPNVSAAILSTAWVKGARVINIGKAGGASSSSTLRKRLRQYIRFGQGQAVGHWGGRYIWQLHGCHSLLICWKATEVEPLIKSRRQGSRSRLASCLRRSWSASHPAMIVWGLLRRSGT